MLKRVREKFFRSAALSRGARAVFKKYVPIEWGTVQFSQPQYDSVSLI
jgi:septum formation topological specificity factor MinE